MLTAVLFIPQRDIRQLRNFYCYCVRLLSIYVKIQRLFAEPAVDSISAPDNESSSAFRKNTTTITMQLLEYLKSSSMQLRLLTDDTKRQSRKSNWQ